MRSLPTWRAIAATGFGSSYQTLTRQIRARQLRPVCADCGRATERANADAVIPHPAGEETQWDWLDLPDPPSSCRWGAAERTNSLSRTPWSTLAAQEQPASPKRDGLLLVGAVTQKTVRLPLATSAWMVGRGSSFTNTAIWSPLAPDVLTSLTTPTKWPEPPL